MKTSSELNPCTVSRDAASRLGVCGGEIPPDRSDEHLLAQARHWCAPLVIAGTSEVFDFTKGYDPNRQLHASFGIGRYDEDRVGMYKTDLFQGEAPEDRRTIHMGLDIGAMEGTPVFAPFAGVIMGTAKREAPGDYGGTIVLSGEGLFSLFGHLSSASADRWQPGDPVVCGDLLGWLGSKAENGGWNPHLHWQLSRLEPLEIDLPGAVSSRNRDLARKVFPDPTNLLRVAIGGWKRTTDFSERVHSKNSGFSVERCIR